MAYPAYTPEEARARGTFLALMWSLSYPGLPRRLPVAGRAAFHAIADALLDLETSYFCPDATLALYLARQGARALPPERAAYHFYPQLHSEQLSLVEAASNGTLLAPDQSATLLLGCKLGAGDMLFELSGPGIPPEAPRTVQVGGLPTSFWDLRQKAIRHPLGWDIFLLDGDQVVGLPRTTHMAALVAATGS